MSAEKANDSASPAVDPARDFFEFWKSYFEQAAIQTEILLETAQGATPPGQSADQLVESLGPSVDRFLRTPAFLEVLKLSLKRMIDLKLMQDRVSQAATQQSGLPLAAGVNDICERVRSAEQSILERLTKLDVRLRAIEESLNSGPSVTLSEGKQARSQSDAGGTRNAGS